AQYWDTHITPDDLVLIPGDISWASRIEDALPDLEWIHKRPGTKVLIRGNHDYWWESISKVRKVLPPSLYAVQNDSFLFNDIAICGARLWDSPEYNFASIIDFENSEEGKALAAKVEDPARFERELNRLEMSLKTLPQQARCKIAMTHYPPIGLNLEPSRVSKLLEAYGISICVFGHLHGIREGLGKLFGEARGVRYVLTACDFLQSVPVRIM
ncbi:MAG: metallophosphoesterase, partial [Rhabdochlamydiaceae bacterium]